MPTQFRQAIATIALVAAGAAVTAGTASAQSYITTEPAQTRTIVREPLNLTPAQRTTVYRTIVPQGRGKQPIVKERVVTETMGSSAPVRERVVVEPQVRDRVVVDQWGRERIVARPAEIDYVVGDRVPGSVQLSPFPDQVVREVPAMSGYRYMTVNDRVLLVDPATNTVVEQIGR